MGKSAPAPPDYEAAARQTAAGNLEMLELQTRANRPDQYTPWGSLTWEELEGTAGTWNPATGRMEGGSEGGWVQNIQLDPAQQAALDQQLAITQQRSELAGGLMGRVQDEFGDVMDWSQFNELGQGVEGGDYYNQEAEDALYGRSTSRLDPRFAQKREATESQLRNQGLRPGDEAYDTAMLNLGNEETDAYQQAQYGATLGAGAEGARMQGMDIGAGGYNTQLRQQQIAEAMQQRGFSLNEINAILSGQQVAMPGMPGFNTAGVVEGADITGAARDTYSAEMDAFSAQQAMTQSVLNAGASAMSMSDARLKKNIEYVGDAHGRRWYLWDWIMGGSDFGVLAQENLDMVAGTINGFMVVYYRRV